MHIVDNTVVVSKDEVGKDLIIWLSSNLFFSHHHQLAAERGYSARKVIMCAFPRTHPDDSITSIVVYVRTLLGYAI